MIDGYSSGILAALGAPLLMTTGFLLWQDHWKGSAFSLNMYKCCTASAGFLLLSLTLPTLQRDTTNEDDDQDAIVQRDGHTRFPSTVFTMRSVGFLFLSSTVGIVIGDWTWLQALQLLGAQPVILMDALKPFLASLLGWWLLGEDLKLLALGAMVLTVLGITLVAVEQNHKDVGTTLAEAKAAKNATVHVEDSGDMQVCNAAEYDNGNFVVVRPNSLSSGETDAVEKQVHGTVKEHGSDCDEERSHETGDYDCLTKWTEAADCNDPLRPPTCKVSSFPTSDEEVYVPPDDLARVQVTAMQQRKRAAHIGYTYSALNVVLDAYGSVLTKQYGTQMTVWEINLLRFGFAGVVLMATSVIMRVRAWLISTWRVQPSPQNNISKSTPWYALPWLEMSRSSWLRASVGVVLVTFLSPTLSNYSLFEISLGLALTLTSIGPLYEMPLSYLLNKKHPTLRSLAGAVLAIAGVAILAFLGKR